MLSLRSTSSIAIDQEIKLDIELTYPETFHPAHLPDPQKPLGISGTWRTSI